MVCQLGFSRETCAVRYIFILLNSFPPMVYALCIFRDGVRHEKERRGSLLNELTHDSRG